MKYIYQACRAGGQDKYIMQLNNEIQYTKTIINTLWPGLYGDDHLAMVRVPQRSLSSQSLGKYYQLNQNNQKTEHIPSKTSNTKRGSNKQQHNKKHDKI